MTISGVTSGRSMIVLTVAGTAPAPALQTEGEPDADRDGDEHAAGRQEQRAAQGILQRRLVERRCPISPVNQRVEKPCQVVRERPSLKANSTAIPTGTIDQRMYPSRDDDEEARLAPWVPEPAHATCVSLSARRVERR